MERLGDELRDVEFTTALTDNCNMRHRNAAFAARASVQLYTIAFFTQKQKEKLAQNPSLSRPGIDRKELCRLLGERERGIITRVVPRNVGVLIPKYGIEGIVSMQAGKVQGKRSRELKDGYRYDETTKSMISSSKPTLAVFEEVELLIFVDDTDIANMQFTIEIITTTEAAGDKARAAKRVKTTE